MAAEELSYEEWLRRSKEQLEGDRRRFMEGARPDEEYRDMQGRPVNHPLPTTGDPAYDAKKPRRQASTPSARRAMGISDAEIEAIRAALDRGESPNVPGYTVERTDHVPPEERRWKR